MRSMPSGWKPFPGRAIALSARRSWKRASWKKLATNLLEKAKRRCVDRISFASLSRLIQVKSDFDVHLHCNGTTVFFGGIELPGLYALDGLFIQAHTQRAHHAGIMYSTVGAYDDIQHHHALILGLPRLFRKLWFGCKDRTRRTHAVTHMKDYRTND